MVSLGSWHPGAEISQTYAKLDQTHQRSLIPRWSRHEPNESEKRYLELMVMSRDTFPLKHMRMIHNVMIDRSKRLSINRFG